jgi:tRNA pseudouridine55 synthase
MVLNPEQPVLDREKGNIILVDKPEGWTSFDVVNKIRYPLRRWSGSKKYKVGHAGTLDPFATGLLIVCTGKHTKEIDRFQGQEKEYEGRIKFGVTTPSLDTETEEQAHDADFQLNRQELQTAMESFQGVIMQKPPLYSAIRKEGQRLYHLARKGEDVQVAPRPVQILQFRLLVVADNTATFTLKCTKGTYVRSLARDLGRKLGTEAYLTSLRRTGIGEFRVDDAWTIDMLAEFLNSQADAHIQGP